MSDDLKGFAISPKLNCPHLKDDQIQELITFLTQTNQSHFSDFQCKQCLDKSQNWVCIECKVVLCSRYVKSHMAEHNNATKHLIALSFSDASFWCYDCQSYIDSPSLRGARASLSNAKFALPAQKNQTQELAKELQKLQIKQQIKPLTVDQVSEGLKSEKYKNVVFLTGAGLSVGAGIPDFRTPGTGLYSKLQQYNLPCPQAVFELNYFKKNPQPFFKVAKQFLSGKFQPTLGHKFIKIMNDKQFLLMNMTQNIDDLQIIAGIPEQKTLQAHGHSRTAHCIECHKQIQVKKWTQALEKDEILRCQCNGLVKPDIIFFGQQLPKKFHQAPQIIKKADLVFIVGTSLAVMPFAFLAQMIVQKVPVVLINNQDSLPQRKDKLWMQGDIQENIKILMDKLQWKE